MFAFLFRRFRWMMLGAAARAGMRALGKRRVEDATNDLRHRLPDRAVKVADAMPGDVLRAAGSGVVASQTAMRSARAAKQIATAKDRASDRLRAARGELRAGVIDEERSYRSDLLRYTRGETEATDALLDVRAAVDSGPLPAIPPPVSRRRWRRVRRAAPVVARVQRTYVPRPKPWD